MEETLKALRAASYVLLTVCGAIALFGSTASTTTPFRGALREIDALSSFPWANLRSPDSLHVFVFRPRKRVDPEDTLPLSYVLLRRLGSVDTVGGRVFVTLSLSRIAPVDTLFLLDDRFEVDPGRASSDGPGSRVEIVPPPRNATLAEYEKYLRDNPVFRITIPFPEYRVGHSWSGRLHTADMKGTCKRLAHRCVLEDLRAIQDSVSGEFILNANVRGLGDQVHSMHMSMRFRKITGSTDLRLADWLSRYPQAGELVRPEAARSQGNGLVFLPASQDMWPELRGLTLGQARLLLTSKIRASEKSVKFLGLEVPEGAVAIAGPGVLLFLLAHLALLAQHLRNLLKSGDADPVHRFPLPLLFPGPSGALVVATTSLVFPLVSCAALIGRAPAQGAGRWAFFAGMILVVLLGVRLAALLTKLRRDLAGCGQRESPLSALSPPIAAE